MTTNPYQPPTSVVEKTRSIGDSQIPLDILRKIKRGWITLGILSVLNLIMGGYGEGLVNLALTYGLYRRNRFVATFVFGLNALLGLGLAIVQFALLSIDDLSRLHNDHDTFAVEFLSDPIRVLFLWLIYVPFLYITYHAMVATYQYRKIIHSQG